MRRTGRLRKLLGWVGNALVLGWIVVACTMLLVRHVALPAVGQFRGEIAAAASQAIGLPVRIGTIDGD